MSEYIFKLPDLGEGTVESEIGEWHVGVGDDVAEEDIVATMMTDKAAVEISSPVSGKVKSLPGEPGDIVAVGSPLIIFETDSPATAEEPDATPEDQPEEKPGDKTEDKPKGKREDKSSKSSAPADNKTRVMTSPAIRRRAKEAGIDLTQVPGTGTGGRILRADFDAYVEQDAAGQSAATRRRDAEPATREDKVIGLRRVIAERMSAANNEVPHFAYVEEIDVTELEALRQHLNGRTENRDQRLTLLPFICLALIRALKQFPQCNTTYDKDRNVLVRHGAVHLGIATQTPDGLKVPVVRNSQRRTVNELSAEIGRVSEAARNNTIKREDLTGSTITVTSLGKLGGIVTTPVINMPEVAIIGVNRAVERPVVIKGQVAVRLMMNLSSSFDHRFVDGYDAANMIQTVKDMLEHPATIFLE